METKNSEVFGTPKSMFQQKISDIMKDDPTKDLILDIFELQMFKNADKDNKSLIMIELYNLLGFEKFVEVVELLGGKTIKFLARSEFKELVETALAYYYRTFRGYDWTKIKELIGDSDMSSVKFGSRMQQLSKFIAYLESRVGKRHGKFYGNQHNPDLGGEVTEDGDK